MPPLHPRCRCAIMYREVRDVKPKDKPRSNETAKPVINPVIPATIPATIPFLTPSINLPKPNAKPIQPNKPNEETSDFEFDPQRFGIYEDQVKSHGGSGNIKPDKVIEGHERTPSKTMPLNIIDHKDYKGVVDKRIFYDETGQPYFEINTTNHGNAKNHPYGKHGEHAHDIKWSEGKAQRETRELNAQERKDNGDIL